MAMTDGSEVSSGNTASGGFLGGLSTLGNLYIDYRRVKAMDVETGNDDSNIPDQADLNAGYSRAAARDALGGVFNKTYGGMMVRDWLILAAAVGATAYALKKLEVF